MTEHTIIELNEKDSSGNAMFDYELTFIKEENLNLYILETEEYRIVNITFNFNGTCITYYNYPYEKLIKYAYSHFIKIENKNYVIIKIF